MTENTPDWKYYYERAKAQGTCYACGKEDAYTLIGKTLCADCMKKRVDNNRKCRERHKEENRKKNHEIILKLKSEGICTVCRHRKAQQGYTTCKHCRDQAVIRRKKRRPNNGKLSPEQALYCGLCTRCRKEPHMEGRKLCPDCYADALKALEKARVTQTERNKNHPAWRVKHL